MKKSIFSIFTFLSVLSNTQMQAAPCEIPCENKSFYGEIFCGANFLQIPDKFGPIAKFNPGYIVCGEIGYNYYDLRIELEFAFRHNSFDKKVKLFPGTTKVKGHGQTASYMVNLLWDIPLHKWGVNLWNIQPFIGTGIGYDLQHISVRAYDLQFVGKIHDFSWQFIAGLAYPIFQNADLSIEYKLHNCGSDEIYNHAIGLGLRYNFEFF